MASPARQLSQPPATDPHVVTLRVGDPYYRGLCNTYHQLKGNIRSIEHRRDPASLRKARDLDRARLLLLEAIVRA